MTSEEVRARWDGTLARTRDLWVAQRIVGWGVMPEAIYCKEKGIPHCRAAEVIFRGQVGFLGDKYDRIPPYSTSISDAWEVFNIAMGWYFSKRQAFFKALQDIASQKLPSGSMVAWPDVLAVLCNGFPASICLAALMVAEKE